MCALQVFELDVPGAPVVQRQLQLKVGRRQSEQAPALTHEVGLPAQLDRQRAAQRCGLVDLGAARADRVKDDGTHGALLRNAIALQFVHALHQSLCLARVGRR